MVLSLKSGIHHEVNWALDRLCRLCDNERFHLQELPGLIEALFEWPRWLLHDGLAAQTPAHALFSSPAEHEKKTRHALLSILVLRSASLNLPNATALAASPRTRPLILAALQRLDPAHDTHAEFLLYTVELFLAILPVAPGTALAFPPGQNPIPILADLAHSSSNRSLAIAALSTLSLIFAEPQNAVHLRSTTSALDSAVRFLPAFTLGDKELSEACVSYLYTHLSNSHMAKAFLLHPDMASTLRLLIMLLVAEQEEETNMIALGPAPVLGPPPRFRMLSALELEELGPMPEPDRSLHW
jgi:chromatin structure-remodeling complex subunit RSC9